MLVVIDPGNFSTKYFYRKNGEVCMGCFSSVAHEYVPMVQTEDTFCGKQKSMQHVQYMGIDKYIGEGAKNFYEEKRDETCWTGGVRKGHINGLFRIVLSLHEIWKQTGINEFTLAVTSPIKSLNRDKPFFEENLKKHKSAIIDGETFSFDVKKLIAGAEGLGAKKFAEQKNCIIIDAGSQTTNVLRFINDGMTEKSKTLNFGTENHSIISIVDGVSREISDVDYEHTIRVTGGKADAVARALRDEAGYQNCLAVDADGCDQHFINGYGMYLLVESLIESGDDDGE